MRTDKIKTLVSRMCAVVAAAALFTSCEDFVTVSLTGGKVGIEEVFTDDATAESVVRGVYSSVYTIVQTSMLYPMFMADELGCSATEDYSNVQQNDYDEQRGGWFLNEYYHTIYCANTVIEGLAASTGVSDAAKKRFTGEAKFMRAYSHFILTNFYGEIPVITTSDVRKSSMLPKSPVEDVYTSIITDLKDAYGLLSDDYPAGDRIRVNKAACAALLAKVYLYHGDWPEAEAEASKVIANSDYELLTDLNGILKKGSREIIWQLWMHDGRSAYTQFLVASSTTSARWWTMDVLADAIEPGDQRKTAWLGVDVDGRYYFNKYKNTTTTTGAAAEYSVQLRLAEQYLIRAEARAQQNNVTGTGSAASDLNEIRDRAGLGATDATTKEAMLAAIEHERRVEMMAEPFQRWFDLKRTGRAIPVLSALKETWTNRAVLLPYPVSMLNSNPNLVQNDGYDY